MIRRALISVSDKTGVVDFARGLFEMGVEIITTGGTAKTLEENGVGVTKILEVTGFPEILDGRVKTLHPKIHGGILALRNNNIHLKEIEELGIQPIDLVAVNLYPFKQTIERPGVTFEEAVENIDIGGPAMLRSAAKNHEHVIVVCDPGDYPVVLDQLKQKGDVGGSFRRQLAIKAFEHTAHYDAVISEYLRGTIEGQEKGSTGSVFPKNLTLAFEKLRDLRYGENPHQMAAFYRDMRDPTGIAGAKKLAGKELSFNNINDAGAALALVLEFGEPCAVAVKHTNPCGVACGADLHEAYLKAYAADPVSIFGGIVALNRPVDAATAEEISKIFLEIVIAPGFNPDALEILKARKNLRLLEVDMTGRQNRGWDLKRVSGGLLVQEPDVKDFDEKNLKVVTKRPPTEAEMRDLMFAWKVVKHVKSNAIVLAKDRVTVGIGMGQVNRIWPTRQSIAQAGERARGAVLASDAFFPFPDVVEAAAAAGITAIIQPGGSVRDEESIRAGDERGIAMLFTGVRHFKH
ncbi:bifunctional phosphoribosylaminoimidazolecarboxamide formyltransferase/IMP cyclohydrolase [Thermosediminibacter litoriperuensis]|uniref:Bifunctional purine biosynthesis protein PurH n=1 Tax=Thermosediminibacter litoriperuensis TaxID=291989 RepID=A0A5S5AYF6_9FIRM|nr:bifunctional phosphoribosylaminoimidazolecarboxamide formyltransferase/IMP cyclohydrolase [Thermosediminibacter litoriperuensis]TYP58511.1 phosphoribosylaminoimidazolecarboxamide formyltransferase/IMP cyclohydrolase [Thermosediminibacter litoriperuensis]